jgi:hypothetical protein
MKGRIVAVLMVALISFAGMSNASAQRTRVIVNTPNGSVHVSKGYGGVNRGGPGYYSGHRGRHGHRGPVYHGRHRHARHYAHRGHHGHHRPHHKMAHRIDRGRRW